MSCCPWLSVPMGHIKVRADIMMIRACFSRCSLFGDRRAPCEYKKGPGTVPEAVYTDVGDKLDVGVYIARNHEVRQN